MGNNSNTIDEEYTIVLDKFYVSPDNQMADMRPMPGTPEHEEMLAREIERKEREAAERQEAINRMYYEYEKMRLKDPGIVDKDEVYPHSYYWRMGDRYDPGKIEVLKEALAKGMKLEDTESYIKYVEEVKSRKYAPASWD